MEGSCPSTESGLDLDSTTSEFGRTTDETDSRNRIGGIGCEKFCDTRLVAFGGEGVSCSYGFMPRSSSGSCEAALGTAGGGNEGGGFNGASTFISSIGVTG